MKITKYGIIMALKNLGVWLGSWSVAGIKTDTPEFMFAFLMYALISIPSDLYLLNHMTESIKDSYNIGDYEETEK